MHLPTTFLLTTTLLSTSLAIPVPPCQTQTSPQPTPPPSPPQPEQPPTSTTPDITAEQILAIDPRTSTCKDDPNAPGECRTAAEAVDPINASFAKYGLDSVGERAAALALMLFESGAFKYDRSHFPEPVPGKGTRNMQSPDFNLAYAADVAGAQAAEAASANGPDAVLDLVLGDEASFGSAAWFLATQCGDDVREALKAGTQDGWEAYLGPGCINTEITDERNEGWKVAMEVLGGQ